MDWRTSYCYIPQVDLQIQCNHYQNFNFLIYRNDKLIIKSIWKCRKTRIGGANLEKGKQG